MKVERSGGRVAGVALAVAALGAWGPTVLGADEPTCSVRNMTQDTRGRSLIRMVERANDGDHIRVDGTCPGPVDIQADIAIRGAAAGATITGRDRTRVLRVARTAIVTLRDLTIERGHPPDDSSGGGVKNRGSLTIVDSAIRRNRAPFGAGLYAAGKARTLLRRVLVADNTGAEGGGIRNDSTEMRIVDSVITENRAPIWDDEFGGAGGGIANDGSLTLVRSRVIGNRATMLGGGIVHWGGDLSLVDSVVRSNRSLAGAGIYTAATLALKGTRVVRNVAIEEGGGILALSGESTVALDGSSSVTGNTPDDCVGAPAC